MNLIPGVCTQCGATLSVEEGKDCMICPYCNTPFIVEKAIQQFNTTYIINNNYNAENIYINNAPEEKDFKVVAGKLVKYLGESADVVIPEGVRIIGEDVFKGTSIISVEFSDTVEEIEHGAFEDCKRLEKVSNSSNVKSIGIDAFRNCGMLVEFDFSSVKSLGRRAFEHTQIAYANLSVPITVVKGFREHPDPISINYLQIPPLDDVFMGSPYHRRYVDKRCLFCGGKLKGLFPPICVKCGQKKSYL